MYPAQATLQLAHDQSMVESGVKEGGKNTASFLFREWTQQHKHEASS